MTDVRDMTLTQKQYNAFTTYANEILYGGSAGSGKSHLMRYASVIWAMTVPGLQIYLFRRKYNDLEKNHLFGPNGYVSLLHNLSEEKKVRINYSKLRIDFSNGSQIHLCHCNHDKDRFNYHGTEMHVLLIDELTHFTKEIYTYLRHRVRMAGLTIDYNNLSKQFPWMKPGFFPRIMCGTNPGGVGHCLPHGDVLTTSGWKPIQDVQIGDEVYSVTSNREMVKKKVSNTFEYDFEGELKHSKVNTFEFCCTSGHRIPYLPTPKKNIESFSIAPFDELPNEVNLIRSMKWEPTNNSETFKLDYCPPSRKRKNPPIMEISYRDYAELMGWYLSEGSLHKPWGVSIAQIKEPQRTNIIDLYNRIGFKPKEYEMAVNFNQMEWNHYFKQFGKAPDKFVPDHLKNSKYLDVFFQSLMAGDGHWNGDESGHYYTISRQLADDVQEIALKLGYIVSVTSRLRDNRKHKCYEISLRKNKTGCSTFNTGNSRYKNRTSLRNHTEDEYYKGKTYCIEVPDTHTFIVRQFGHISVTGNSSFKSMFVDPKPPNTVWDTPVSEGGMRRVYIPALVYENPFLLEEDPDYMQRLKGMGDKHMVAAMLTGDWDIIAGGALDDVWKRDVHVIEPFEIPKDWYIDRTYDWGSAKPYSMNWWAESNGNPVKMADGSQRTFPRGTVFLIDEVYGWNGEPNVGSRQSTTEQGDILREKESGVYWGNRVKAGAADSSIFDKTYTDDDEKTLHDYLLEGYNTHDIKKEREYRDLDDESFRKLKFHKKKAYKLFKPANKSPGSRVKGLEMLRTHLKASLENPMESPGLFIFSNCVHWIRTVPVIPRDEKNPEDVDTEAEDHCFDATRYRLFTKQKQIKQLNVRGL